MGTDQNVRDLLAAAEEALTEASFRTGDFAAAREAIAAAQAAAVGAGDFGGQARAQSYLGLAAHYENIATLASGSAVDSADIEAEEKIFRQALAHGQDAGEQAGTAQALFGLGLVFQVLRQDWMTAMPYYWQALGLVSGTGAEEELYLRSEVHRHVGFYYLVEDVQPSEAVRHLQLSLDLREELGDPRRIPSGLTALAEAELSAGGQDRAIDLLTEAIAQAHAAGLLPRVSQDAERALREAEATRGADAAGDAALGSSPPEDAQD
jgi:tetratricopeptide (TPR) repeat protein